MLSRLRRQKSAIPAQALPFVAQQLAGFAVDEVQPGAGRTSYGFVLVLDRVQPDYPVLHFQIGSGADKNQVHSTLIGASAQGNMIYRKFGIRRNTEAAIQP